MVYPVDVSELAAMQQNGYQMQPVAVYIPSMYEGGYDEYNGRHHKNHTLLVSTLVGLLAAGGALYACRGKNSKVLYEEIRAWGENAYQSLKDIWADKVASEIKPKD